ncbi:MAG: serine--tRNA ligase, partial [Caldimonas sp.]
MLDIALLRKDLGQVIARLETRQSPQPFLDVARFTALEGERKSLQTRTEELQARRNTLSRDIGRLKGQGGDASTAMAGVAGIAEELARSAERLAVIQAELHEQLMALP